MSCLQGQSPRKRWMIAAITFAAIAVIVIVIVVPVVEVKKKREAENSFEANNSSSYPISPYAHLTQIVTRNDSEIQSKKRIFVTGDLHGCLSEFNQLLTKINYNPAKDQMVLAGDLTSKGPDSLGVLRRAKELGILCVRGNHDDKLIRFKTFENERGIQVMDGKGTMPEGDVPDPLKFNNYHEPLAVNMTQGDYDYLLSCPVILHLPFLNNTVVVHGGLDPNIRMLKDQIPYLIMTMRDIDKKGRPTATSGKGTQWGIEWNEYQRSLSTNNTLIYYGHDAGRGLNLQNYTFGLDTGCVYGRHLTTINILNHQLYQINCTTDYTTDQDDDD